MKTVLIADVLPDVCTEILQNADLEVVDRPGLSPEELKEALKGVHGVICRSGAKLTEDALEGADELEAVCRAGVGVNNIDLAAAARKGVVVMNTPGGNTTSTGEHAFALMLALARNIGPAYISMREGRWDKKKFTGSQLAGATLGIIGLGRIGQVVAKRAVAFQMEVLAHDPYVSRDTAEKMGVTLVDGVEDMLGRVDYLTLHVPETGKTRGMIGPEQIAQMKDTACLINCARGGVADMDAVVQAVREGRLGGAAFDVYPEEPPQDCEFARHNRILATPHLGASTEEAQMAVATQAAEQMVDALTRSYFRNSVNVATVPPEEMRVLQPYCDIAARLGRLVASLNSGHPAEIAIACKGEIADRDIDVVVNHGVMGVLQPLFGPGVNAISAPHIAEERGISITSTTTVGLEVGFTDLLTITLRTDTGTSSVAGTVFGRKYPRIVRIEDFYVEVLPEGTLLVVRGQDVPGLIGKVGGILGQAGLNIARMGFGRLEQGGQAVLALNLDTPAAEDLLEQIRNLDVVHQVTQAEL